MRIEPGARRAKLAEAYLAHRVSGAELKDFANSLETPSSDWEDRFEAATKVEAVKPNQESIAESEVLESIGLRERFQNLSDQVVWTGEDRALYRRLAHPETRLTKEQPGSPEGFEFGVVLNDNFAAWDADGSLSLQPQELDLMMSGGYYGQHRAVADSPQAAAALAVATHYGEWMSSASSLDGAGISQTDLNLIAQAEHGIMKDMRERTEFKFQEYLERSEVGTKPLSSETINPMEIRQGSVGSCVALSTMAGMKPHQLLAMFTEYGDQTIEVSFADGVTERVADPTLAERLYHTRGKDDDRWPAVVEIALAQRLYHEDRPDNRTLRGAIDGIEPERALKAFTGRPADRRNLDQLTVDQTRQALAELTCREGPVICGSRPVALGDFVSVEELHNGIENGHCYTVLDFSAETDEVTLRNPWGRGEWRFQESPDDGVFKMPLRDFYSSYRWVAGTQSSQDK